LTPVIVAIVVAAGDGQGQVTQAMREAAIEALGSGARVRLRELPVISDEGARIIERELGAQVVALVSWRDSEHLQAQLRVHMPSRDLWTDRSMEFTSTDSPLERGRTLGFAIAAMLPEEVLPREEGAEGGSPETPAPPDRSTASGPRAAASLKAIGSLGVGGPASAAGAGVDVDLFVVRRLSLGAGGGVRNGAASPVPGSHFSMYFAAGFAWWALLPAPGADRGPSLGLRADARALYESVVVTGGGLTGRSGRWLPAADLAVELAWSLGHSLAVVAATGAEVAFGVTDIYVEQQVNGASSQELKGVIPILRAIGELGIRVQF
jgi:hypothetical protein